MQKGIRPYWMLLPVMAFSALIVCVSAGKNVEYEKSASVARQAVRKTEEPGFVLRESEGHLALFREGAERPYQILDTEVWLLPEADRQALAEGIVVKDEAALRQLLEDMDAAADGN
ncbi:MAG: hypothetical protein K5695_09195 [Oscillospiraceae bacterium]|nr:hypothetical protein [Oscillospiraceae bacterium]